jgi:hypothetical protein
MSTTTRPITADELLAMGDIGRCELIYGEVVMMIPAGLPHGVVAMRIGSFLREFVDQHGLGVAVAAETGFKIESDPDLVRAPDVGFIKNDRLPGTLPRGFLEGVPDLAVEVVSPDDSKRELDSAGERDGGRMRGAGHKRRDRRKGNHPARAPHGARKLLLQSILLQRKTRAGKGQASRVAWVLPPRIEWGGL